MSFLQKFAFSAERELGLSVGLDMGAEPLAAEVSPAPPVRAMSAAGQGDTRSDFDGDGVDDILFFNFSTGSVGQFQMPDASWSLIGQASLGWIVSAIGFFDNDDASGRSGDRQHGLDPAWLARLRWGWHSRRVVRLSA